MVNEPPPLTEEEIQQWLINYLSRVVKISSNEIDVTAPFAFYGFDSLIAVSLTSELKVWLGIDLAPTLAYEYPNVETLSRHLTELCLRKK